MNDIIWTNDVLPLLEGSLTKAVYEKHFINSTATAPDNGHLDIHGVDKTTHEHYWDRLHSQVDPIIKRVYGNPKALEFFVKPKPEPVPEPKIEEDDYQGRFKPYSMLEVISRPDKIYLVDKIFGSRDIGMIFGYSGSGKGFIVIDLILSCLLGRKFAGKFDVLRPLTVAYCTDEGLDDIPQRFKAALKKYNVSSDVLDNFTFYEIVPQLFDPKHPDFADIFVSEYRATRGNSLDVLWIDTLHNATVGSNEKDEKDALTVINNLKRITQELNNANWLVHHAGKDAKRGSRGTSAYDGHCDFRIKVQTTKDDNKSLMISDKQKAGSRWGKLECTRNSIAGYKSVYLEWSDVAEVEGETVYDKCWNCLSSNSGKLFQASEVAGTLNISQSNIKPELDKLVKDGKAISRLKDTDKMPSSRNPVLYQADPLEVIKPL